MLLLLQSEHILKKFVQNLKELGVPYVTKAKINNGENSEKQAIKVIRAEKIWDLK